MNVEFLDLAAYSKMLADAAGRRDVRAILEHDMTVMAMTSREIAYVHATPRAYYQEFPHQCAWPEITENGGKVLEDWVLPGGTFWTANVNLALASHIRPDSQWRIVCSGHYALVWDGLFTIFDPHGMLMGISALNALNAAKRHVLRPGMLWLTPPARLDIPESPWIDEHPIRFDVNSPLRDEDDRPIYPSHLRSDSGGEWPGERCPLADYSGTLSSRMSELESFRRLTAGRTITRGLRTSVPQVPTSIALRLQTNLVCDVLRATERQLYVDRCGFL